MTISYISAISSRDYPLVSSRWGPGKPMADVSDPCRVVLLQVANGTHSVVGFADVCPHTLKCRLFGVSNHVCTCCTAPFSHDASHLWPMQIPCGEFSGQGHQDFIMHIVRTRVFSFPGHQRFIALHISLCTRFVQVPHVCTCPLWVYSVGLVDLSGKSPSVIEHTPAVQSLAEIAEMERKNELRLKIKEEHLAALQFEGSNWKKLRWYFSVENRPLSQQPTWTAQTVSMRTQSKLIKKYSIQLAVFMWPYEDWVWLSYNYLLVSEKGKKKRETLGRG